MVQYRVEHFLFIFMSMLKCFHSIANLVMLCSAFIYKKCQLCVKFSTCFALFLMAYLLRWYDILAVFLVIIAL